MELCVQPFILEFGTLETACHHYALILPARSRKDELKKILESEKAIAIAIGNVATFPNPDELLNFVFQPDDDTHEDLFDEEFDLDFIPPEEDVVDIDVPKDTRYPTDVDIATVVFRDAIIPDLKALREKLNKWKILIHTKMNKYQPNACSLSASASSSSTANSNLQETIGEIDKILLVLDEEYVNLEYIMKRLVAMKDTDGFEYLKHAAGCSLWQQTLDLCKGFWLWRQKIHDPPRNST